MLKNKLQKLLLIIMVIALALSPLSFADNETTEDKATNATNNEQEQNTTATGETQEANEDALPSNAKSGDQYLVGDKITVDYMIDGNLYAMADEITISSQVVGNAYLMANKITITNQSYIGASVYALGNTVEINGITLDAYIASENVSISGLVYRDLHCVAENFNLYGGVGRDASLCCQSYNFKKDGQDNLGQIMGNLYYSAKQEYEFPKDIVRGSINYSHIEEYNYTPNYVFLAISSVIFVVIVWAFLKWLAPKFVEKCDQLVTSKPLKTIGFGLLALIVIPIMSIILMITGVAASAGLILLALYLILICIARSISIIAINNAIAKKIKFDTTAKQFLLLVVLALAIWAVTFVPFAWLIVNLILGTAGFGIITRNLLDKKTEE